MRLSRYFLPTLKDDPAEAQIASHRLMLRAGLIRQEASGIYAWLPLGLRVLHNIERIVREEMNRAGALELLMPTLQLADLWREPRASRLELAGLPLADAVSLAEHVRGAARDPEEIGQLFRRFYRGAQATQRLVPGAGLGLSVVHGIVEAHGGRVHVESAPGEGSTFHVELPVAH